MKLSLAVGGYVSLKQCHFTPRQTDSRVIYYDCSLVGVVDLITRPALACASNSYKTT